MIFLCHWLIYYSVFQPVHQSDPGECQSYSPAWHRAQRPQGEREPVATTTTHMATGLPLRVSRSMPCPAPHKHTDIHVQQYSPQFDFSPVRLHAKARDSTYCCYLISYSDTCFKGSWHFKSTQFEKLPLLSFFFLKKDKILNVMDLYLRSNSLFVYTHRYKGTKAITGAISFQKVHGCT